MTRQIAYQVNVDLVGVTSLIMHKCPEIKTGVTGNKKSYEDEWIQFVYVNDDGVACAPSQWIMGALFQVARSARIKLGKTPLKTILASALRLPTSHMLIPLLIDGKPVTIQDIKEKHHLDTQPVVIARSRVMMTRPCFAAPWTLKFPLEIYNAQLTSEILKDILERAGSEAGIGCWRPSSPKPGMHGQFEVKKWKVKKG